MQRRDFLRCAGALTGAALVPDWLRAADAPGAASAAPLAGRRPNIILILTDDQGYGDLGRNGNPVIQTPRLDRFYDEAVRFEDFHVSPTCAPTRSSILSGKHEFKNGVTHTIHERERMSLRTTTLAQVLKAAGYATGIFGKWHLGDEDAYQPDKRGFDEVFIHGAGGIGQTYPGTCGDAPGNSYFDPVVKHNGTFVKTSGYCTDVFFGRAREWIAGVKGRAPFFAMVTPNAPHGPLHCPPRYEALYAGKVPPAVASFFGMISNIDENVGALLDQLKSLGLEGETLVIFMNDNGGTAGCKIWNAGMRGQKGSAFNGGTRGMSLWRWPGTLRPGARHALTAHLDLFPTLAELARAAVAPAVAAGFDGFSLVPLLGDAQAPWHPDRMLFTHVGRWAPGTAPVKYGECSVRWQQYLQVRGKGGWQLYDLVADPGEGADLAAKKPDVVVRLDAAYDAWWAAVLPCLENEDAHKTAPAVNPFKAQYWKQFDGPGPNGVGPDGAVGKDGQGAGGRRRANKAGARALPLLLLATLLGAGSARADIRVEAKSNSRKEAWESYPTRRLEDLAGFRTSAVPLNVYGGRTDRRVTATGYFRVQREGGRWWLVDPDGGLFLHVGVASVTSRAQYGSRESFARLFGDKARWAGATQELLRGNGFNGTGGWSDGEALRQAPTPSVYTISLRLAADFGGQLGLTHQQPGHTGFAGDCIPALHPDFAAFCEERCRKLDANAADRWLLGYYSDNELPASPKMLDNALAFAAADRALAPLRGAAWDWLRARRGTNVTVEAVTAEDREAFLGHVYDVYLRCTTAAIRRYDPHHLCLGPRFHGPVRERRAVWEAAGRHLDVIAMNYYSTWTPRAQDLANWAAWSGKPCMITEFYVKGADTPFPNTTGAGWIVRTQADRGWFYQNFTLALLEARTCVGWHWFKYMDNDPADTSTDPSNRDSNKGIVTVRYEPYKELLERMRPLNRQVYGLADYFDGQK